jgi:hypothetical protein
LHPQLLLAGTQWAQLFFALSALILLHEFGHFFFAKLFKVKVEKFYLFFDFCFLFRVYSTFRFLSGPRVTPSTALDGFRWVAM